MERITVLHPGQMGISIAVSARAGGNEVYWVSNGRSPDTRARAEQHALIEVGSLAEAVAISDIIISL